MKTKGNPMKKRFILTAAVLLTGLLFSHRIEGQTPKIRTLFVVGFAVPGEAIQKEIAPAFAKQWAARHPGDEIRFQYSWGGSSVQARNVIAGLDADVVYLSDWTDVHRIEEAGLITHEWNARKSGIVSRSLVVFRVNPGNLLGLKDWPDLMRQGVKVLTPNPQTSGSARWNILALYGSVLKKGGTPEKAESALRALYRNIVTLGESGRATTQDFERGIGDVALTYENEAWYFRRRGRTVEFVIPPSTIIIENAAAVVDRYASGHGVEDVARAFVEFLRSAEAQRILASWGFRPVDEVVAAEFSSQYPSPEHSFDIEELGGWPKIQKELFEAGGLWEKIVLTERRGAR